MIAFVIVTLLTIFFMSIALACSSFHADHGWRWFGLVWLSSAALAAWSFALAVTR